MRDLMVSDPNGADGTTPRRRNGNAPSTARRKKYATQDEAIAELERRHGRRSAEWPYHNAAGELVGIILRWDRQNGKKVIRPVSRHGTDWIIGGMPTPRPLYRRPELVKAKRIFIFEGEKVADAGRAMGLTATTSPHGAQSADKTDWSPLIGKDAVIMPDNDKAGQSYANAVIVELSKLRPAPTIKLVELPDLPVGGDVVEYVEARRAAGLSDETIRDELEALATAATPIELGQPVRTVATFTPFPVNVLPEPMRSLVTKGAQAIGCDSSFIALPLLSAVAAAIGNTRCIQLKPGWTEPAIIWTAIVGESGTSKTPAFKLVMQPIDDRQDNAFKQYAEDKAKFEADLQLYEKDFAAWKHGKADGDVPPVKPEPPQAVRYAVSDTTIEALIPILLANPRGVLASHDELAGWIRGFDAYKAGSGGDAQRWLSMHNGGSIVVDRKTGELRTIYVPSAVVSVTGGVQPCILQRVLGQEHRESGLLARLLLAAPPRRPKRWSDAEVPASVGAAMRTVFDRLYELEPAQDMDGKPRPRNLKLTPEGKRAWIEFYNTHAEEHAELTGDLSAAWSKLEGYAARLALVVHCVRLAAADPTLADADTVDDVSIAAGVTLSRWFGHEAKRVYGILAESAEDRDRRRLVELIERKGGSVSGSELVRSSRSYAKVAEAEVALDELAHAGIGRWEQPSQEGRGAPRARRLVLYTGPVNVYENTVGNSANGNSVDIDKANVEEVASGGPGGERPAIVNSVNTPDSVSNIRGTAGERPTDFVDAGTLPTEAAPLIGDPDDPVRLLRAEAVELMEDDAVGADALFERADQMAEAGA